MVTVKELSGVRLIPGDWELNKVLLCGGCSGKALAHAVSLPGALFFLAPCGQPLNFL